MSGLISNPKSVPGQLEGADAIVLGTITNGMYFLANDPTVHNIVMTSISIRVLDMETGEIIMVYRDRILEHASIVVEDEIYAELGRRFAAVLTSGR